MAAGERPRVDLALVNNGQELAISIAKSAQPDHNEAFPNTALVSAGAVASSQPRKVRQYTSKFARSMLAAGQSVAVHSPTSTIVSATLILLLVGVFDYRTGRQLSFGVIYLMPVSFAAWYAGRKSATAMAALAGFVWLAVDLCSGASTRWPVALWNIAARVTVFELVVLILTHIRALHVRLEETVASRTRQLKEETSRRLGIEHEIAAISHREQQRIAHELHDGLGQELGALAFQAKILASKLSRCGSVLAKEAQQFVQALNQSTAQTRALSHLLDPLGERTGALRHALSMLADESGQAYGIACTFEAPDDLPALSAESELNLYRIAQEAIHNAVEHGNASEIILRASVNCEELRMTITDNGRGFAPNRLSGDSRGMGLRIMRYRADSLGATLEISSADGKGCTITCSAPIPECTAY